MALDFRRGRSSKERLQVEWTYPVWKPKDVAPTPGASTVAMEVEHVLPLEQAYDWIAGDDHRPLLVLRECEVCKGTDHALLSRTLDNEQTVLLTHWFRCVKLPTNVVGGNHPFAALFQAQPGEHVPHLFFCDPDGQHRVALPGDQTQAELWDTMFGFLERCYKGDAKKAVKELRTMLSQFDRIDSLEDDVLSKLDDELDRNGKSPKAAKYQTDLDKLQKERTELVQKEQKVRALALRDLNTAPAAVGAAEAAAPK